MTLFTVYERIPLKAEFANTTGAMRAGQAYDVAAGDNAHDAEGHSGHASFFFEAAEKGGALVVIYPWFGRENLDRLLASEKTALADWFDFYAAGPRQVSVLEEVPVMTDEMHQ